MDRFLDEYDILVRHNEAVSVLRKVRQRGEATSRTSVLLRKPFSLRTNFHGAATRATKADPVAIVHAEGIGSIEPTISFKLTSTGSTSGRSSLAVPFQRRNENDKDGQDYG